MDRTSRTCGGAQPTMSTRFYVGPNPPTCRSSGRPSLIWLSTWSRLGRSASPCHRRYSPAPLRGLTSEAPAGFQSRRGLSYDDSAPVSPHNAPFPTYKAPRVHHASRRRGGVADCGAREASTMLDILLASGPAMKCPKCQHENTVTAKFCEECAAPLPQTCDNCGSQVSLTAKFCPQCGYPLRPVANDPRFASPKNYTPQHLADKTPHLQDSPRG